MFAPHLQGETGLTHIAVNDGGETQHVQKIENLVQLEPLEHERDLDFVISVNLSFLHPLAVLSSFELYFPFPLSLTFSFFFFHCPLL